LYRKIALSDANQPAKLGSRPFELHLGYGKRFAKLCYVQVDFLGRRSYHPGVVHLLT
jgi:hypothetical protein